MRVLVVSSSLALLLMFGVVSSNPRREKRSPDLMYHYGPGTSCEVNGEIIQHGQVFTDPSMSQCLQHQCFFGTSFIVTEGCEDRTGGCHAVGEVWEERCITYLCTKTTIGGYNYFQPIVHDARCPDLYGECHEPGEIFSFRLQGRLHHNCRCNITQNRILYKCF